MQPYPPMPSSGHPQRTLARSGFTGKLLVYTWDRLRPEQQEAAWRMVASMRTMRRRRTMIALLLAVAVAAGSVLIYLLVSTPTR
jgi:hypothetical protein